MTELDSSDEDDFGFYFELMRDHKVGCGMIDDDSWSLIETSYIKAVIKNVLVRFLWKHSFLFRKKKICVSKEKLK